MSSDSEMLLGQDGSTGWRLSVLDPSIRRCVSVVYAASTSMLPTTVASSPGYEVIVICPPGAPSVSILCQVCTSPYVPDRRQPVWPGESAASSRESEAKG